MRDNETVVVHLVGVSKKTNEESLKPVAYTRDVLGGLQSVLKKMSVDALERESLEDAIKMLEQMNDDVIKLVKSNCLECLNE
jgi:uncharacterized protein YfeS